MNFYTGRFGLLISFFFLSMLFCGSPDNPFQETSNVNLIIDIPKQPGGFNHCVNDTVRFDVTVVFPHLVKKVSVRYDENGDNDYRDISADSPSDKKISFAYEYKEKGLKNVKFTITLLSGGEKVIPCDTVDIGVKPTIRHEKNLLVGGDVILGKSLILTADHDKFSKAEYRWYKDLKLLPGQDQQSLIFNQLTQSDTGQYYCVVSTAWGTDQSKTFILSFKKTIELPKIIKHPQSLQATEGSAARFIIKATGELLSYQWQKNDIDISGENDTVFELKALSIGDSATLRCIVSNSVGSDTSNNAILKIFLDELTPKITKQPENQEISVGDTARFSIESDGTNLTYQWYENDEKIDDAIQAIYEINQVSSDDNGKSFHCIVSNDKGKDESNKVTLTVKSVNKPKITGHPEDTSVTEGQPVMFKINADGKGLLYQWYENGTKIEQASKQLYIIKEATMADSGNKYSCIISNSAGDVTSNEAILTVVKEIIKPEIIEQPKDLEVTEGNNAKFIIIATGGELTFQWQINQTDIVGATESKYTYKNTKKEDNGKIFRCIVTNNKGKTISNDAVLKIIDTVIAPKIIKQPQNLTIKEKEDATFSITAEGTNLKYQWYKNGKELTGANLSIIKITSAKRIDNNTKYSCIIKNSKGEVKSSEAVLTVTPNDISKPSINITFPNKNSAIIKTRKPTFSWNVFDDKSGIDFSSVVLTVNGVKKQVTQSSKNGSYTPNADSLYDGNYTLKLTVSDMAGNTSVANVSFIVNAKKMSPKVSKDTITINDQIMIYANLSNAYPAVSGKNFNYKLFRIENSNLITVASLNDFGSLNWKENYGIGKYKVTITATDDSGSTVEGSVTYTVINDIPVILNLRDSTISYGESIISTPIINEYNMDSLVYTWQLNNKTISTGKSITINPDKNLIGMKHYIFSVTDDDGNRVADTMRIFTVAGMRKISKGSFLMGDNLGSPYESPAHQVTLEDDFFIDTTEVTQMEYENLLKANPSPSKGLFKPVCNVSWSDAALFCNVKSKMHGLDTVYKYSTIILGSPGNGCKLLDLKLKNDNNGYRLPTDAEWEYTCRAGTTERYYWGSDSLGYAKHEWTQYNANYIQPVAGKLPNPFGLYDMLGNAFEWVHNWYYDYSKGNVTNPMGPENGNFKILRGSSIKYFMNVTTRSTVNGRPYDYSGFRIVLPKAPTDQ